MELVYPLQVVQDISHPTHEFDPLRYGVEPAVLQVKQWVVDPEQVAQGESQVATHEFDPLRYGVAA